MKRRLETKREEGKRTWSRIRREMIRGQIIQGNQGGQSGIRIPDRSQIGSSEEIGKIRKGGTVKEDSGISTEDG